MSCFTSVSDPNLKRLRFKNYNQHLEFPNKPSAHHRVKSKEVVVDSIPPLKAGFSQRSVFCVQILKIETSPSEVSSCPLALVLIERG